MGLSKEQLVFFPADQADSDNVGAYVTDAAGNLITSTNNGGKQSLDVNVTSSITTAPANDSAPATQNITAQDVGSSSTSGANGQSIITGSPTAGSTASFSPSSESTIRVQVTGTWTGSLQSEISNDGGTTWYPFVLVQDSNPITGSSWTANFEAIGSIAGATNFRLRSTAAWTGTATVKVIESLNNALVYIGNPLRLVDSSSGNEAVIKAPSTPAAAGDPSLVVGLSPNSPLPAGSNNIGSVNQGTSPWVVSGTVTANQGTSPWVENLTQVGGSAISLGQKISASSIPVVLASDQSSIPVAATQSGTWTVQQGTPPWSVVGNVADNAADSGNPVKAGSRGIIGSPPSAIGANNDRADLISDKFRRLYVNDGADISAKAQAVTVTTAAAALPASLSGRRNLMIQNLGGQAIYIGADNTVTSANGLKVSSNATLEVEIGEDITLWAIAAGGSQNVRLFELA